MISDFVNIVKGYGLLDELDNRDLENGNIRLLARLRALTPLGIIEAPAGFECDMSSIPWWAGWLIPKSGKWNRSGVIHDWLYKHGGFWNENGVFIKLTQKQCDEIYLGLMESRGVPGWNRKTQYYILRMLGWRQWRKYRKLDKAA